MLTKGVISPAKVETYSLVIYSHIVDLNDEVSGSNIIEVVTDTRKIILNVAPSGVKTG